MKKFILTIVFAAITAASISSCTEQNIKPKDDTGGGGQSSDPCQFGGPGCKP
jgi:hypothetical protein